MKPGVLGHARVNALRCLRATETKTPLQERGICINPGNLSVLREIPQTVVLWASIFAAKPTPNND